MTGRMDGWMDGWINGWINKWSDGRTDGWMGGVVEADVDSLNHPLIFSSIHLLHPAKHHLLVNPNLA